MEVVPEGGSLYTMDMTLIQDGNSTRRAQHSARAFLRRCRQPLGADQDQLHADPGRHLWRPRRRSLLARSICDVWKHPLLSRHAPPDAARRAERPPRRWRRRRIMSTTTARARPRSSPTGACQVSIGAHGQQAGLGAALGDVVVRARRLEPDRGAARRDDHAGDLARLCQGRRLARGRQARRSGRARRRSDGRHPQQRQDSTG